MNLHTIKTGEWKENCFIIANDSGDTLLVDPGDDYQVIAEYLDSHNLNPLAIINTHAHFDHVGAINALKIKYNSKFYLHRNEIPLLKRANLYKAAFTGKGNITIPEVDFLLTEEDKEISIGPFQVTIHHTPGHTSGGICIELCGMIFTGDTLLESNLIPKKLPEENLSSLKASLEYLVTLNPELRNYPGHGRDTLLGTQVRDLILKRGN